ncbi:MAG: hypothetical protein R2932_09070 [Caldilineaceae bacterium]
MSVSTLASRSSLDHQNASISIVSVPAASEAAGATVEAGWQAASSGRNETAAAVVRLPRSRVRRESFAGDGLMSVMVPSYFDPKFVTLEKT